VQLGPLLFLNLLAEGALIRTHSHYIVEVSVTGLFQRFLSERNSVVMSDRTGEEEKNAVLDSFMRYVKQQGIKVNHFPDHGLGIRGADLIEVRGVSLWCIWSTGPIILFMVHSCFCLALSIYSLFMNAQ
jgi:hypothetical protein